MKKLFYAVPAMIFLLGCATVYEPYETVSDLKPVVRKFISLNQIQKGMTPAEVKAVLGSQIVIGYEMPDITQERYKPVVIDNPYRSEDYVKGSRQYRIEYYLTCIRASDDVVTDDELTPLIFENDKLTGWGWDFLERIKELKN